MTPPEPTPVVPIAEVREWPKGVPPCHVLVVMSEPPSDTVSLEEDILGHTYHPVEPPYAHQLEERILRVQQVGLWNRDRQFIRAWAYDEKANVLYLHEGEGNFLPSRWEFLSMALHVHLKGALPGWRWL